MALHPAFATMADIYRLDRAGGPASRSRASHRRAAAHVLGLPENAGHRYAAGHAHAPH